LLTIALKTTLSFLLQSFHEKHNINDGNITQLLQ